MDARQIRETIARWIASNAQKFKGGVSEITPEKQPEALEALFTELKNGGASYEDVLSRMGEITSPLAPKNVKILKLIEKYSRLPDEKAKTALSKWCFAASHTVVGIFNTVFFADGEESIEVGPVYEGMCRQRNIKSLGRGPQPVTKEDVEEHLNAAPIEGIKVVSKKQAEKDAALTPDGDTIEELMKNYKRFVPNPDNVFTEYSQVAELDEEALEFFGLNNVPKEKL